MSTARMFEKDWKIGAKVLGHRLSQGICNYKVGAEGLLRMRFASVDAILAPTVPHSCSQHTRGKNGGNQLSRRARSLGANSIESRAECHRFCRQLACRAGFTRTGLPIGMQIIGRAFDESTVLRLAHAYEEATQWHLLRPGEVLAAHILPNEFSSRSSALIVQFGLSSAQEWRAKMAAGLFQTKTDE